MQSNETMTTESEQKLARILSYLESDPGNRDLLATAIDLHLTLGQVDEAHKHVDTAIALYPADHFFQHRYGNVLIAEGKLNEAQQVFHKLHEELADPGIAYNLAYVYFRLGKHAEAELCLAPYVGLPETPSGTVTLFMRTLHHLGEIKKALDVAERNLESHSEDAEFLAVASLLYLDDGQLEEAQKLSIAVQANGTAPIEALVVGGTVALGKGEIEVAKAQFTEALAVNPADGRSWSGMGLASLLNQDLTVASEQLERAANYLPKHIGTLHSLGWCKILSQDLVSAEAVFRKALSLDRNFGESHGGLAVVAALKGDKALADDCIERALRLDPRSLAARYAQIVMSGNAKDPVKFRELAFKILSARQGPFGGNLAEVLTKWANK